MGWVARCVTAWAAPLFHGRGEWPERHAPLTLSGLFLDIGASVMAEAIEEECAGSVPGIAKKKGPRLDPDISQKCDSEPLRHTSVGRSSESAPRRRESPALNLNK
jgi:hypothetical protein